MADSQALVAEDTIAAGALRGVRHLMDVGGGSGAFLVAAARALPDLRGTLFDLPAVVPLATDRFAREGVHDRLTAEAGSFRDGGLPTGADAISLVRVLYDHQDDTVRALLAAAYVALPPGGRLIVSEPMAAQPGGRCLLRALLHGDGHRAGPHASPDRGPGSRGGVLADSHATAASRLRHIGSDGRKASLTDLTVQYV